MHRPFLLLLVLLFIFSPTFNAITTRKIRRDTKPSRNTIPQYDPGPVDWIPAPRKFPPPKPWKSIDLSPKPQSKHQDDVTILENDNNLAPASSHQVNHNTLSKTQSAKVSPTGLVLDDEDREFEQQLRRSQLETLDHILTEKPSESSPPTTSISDFPATKQIQTSTDALKHVTESQDHPAFEAVAATKTVLYDSLQTRDVPSPSREIPTHINLSSNIAVDTTVLSEPLDVAQKLADEVPVSADDGPQISNAIHLVVKSEPEIASKFSDQEVVPAAPTERTDYNIPQEHSVHDVLSNTEITDGEALIESASSAITADIVDGETLPESHRSSSSALPLFCILLLVAVLLFAYISRRRNHPTNLLKHDSRTARLEDGSVHQQSVSETKPLISSFQDEYASPSDVAVEHSASKPVRQQPAPRLAAVALSSRPKGSDDDEGWNDFDKWDD